MKKFLTCILIVNLAVPLSAQKLLAPAGMTSVSSQIIFRPARIPYKLRPMSNFPDQFTDKFIHYDFLQKRIPKVFYCPKRQRWICDDIPPYVTTEKVIAIKPSSSELLWINRAINAVDDETRKILFENPETRLIFLNDQIISR